MNHSFFLSIAIFYCSGFLFSQNSDAVVNDKRSELGGMISLIGHKPLALNSYNKDFNLVQTNVGTEGVAFYRKYLGEMFDLQLELASGNRYLNVQDSIFSYRVTDLYYAINILPVLKFRDDKEEGKNVKFSVSIGPSFNFLGSRKFAFPQYISQANSDLSFGDVITFAFIADMGIKYNYTHDNSFLIGMRATRDYIILSQDKNDNLEVRYWNYGLYVGFAGKIRKR